ncbi:histone-lysine N-methyltransferase SETMAR [Trichonephila clavipes]|nr:histone-lysine N-methyltransferase SETMAR [Trichonephila clavipes]
MILRPRATEDPLCCSRGSLVVKVTDSWTKCHEFEPSTVEEPPCENASQVAEIANGVYGSDMQFWFRRFRSCIFDVKNVPRAGRPVVENVNKITEIIKVDRHVSSLSIAQELKIDHKTVLSYLRKVGFKKKLHV